MKLSCDESQACKSELKRKMIVTAMNAVLTTAVNCKNYIITRKKLNVINPENSSTSKRFELVATLRLQYEDDYEHGFSVLSTRCRIGRVKSFEVRVLRT